MSFALDPIDGKTRLLGVIGDPVHHSLSPRMHNLACAEWGLNFRYLPFHVTRENLPDAVKGLRAIGVVGFNATIPHKEALVPLMDELDPVARRIGAVNTVLIAPDGRLCGYNTDAYGFMTALREVFAPPLASLSIVVLGAGGAARGVLEGLSQLGAGKIFLVNRTHSKAVDLAAQFSVVPVPWEEMPLEGCQLLINTTSLGLQGASGSQEVDVSRLEKSALVYDIVYSPPLTPLLAVAQAQGLRVENGLGMLIHQGARAFEIWTGHQMPVSKVKGLLSPLIG